MRAKREQARDLDVPPVRNPRRRRRAETDPALWLRTYLPDTFWHPFTANQRALLTAIQDRMNYGGWKCETAPRGEGKTSIIRGTTIWAIVSGRRRFVVIIAANGPDADANLESLRAEFERNDLLADDYPEICVPIRALGGANQRASAQTVAGRRTHLRWTGDRVILPSVDGSQASGALIVSRGIDAAIRGLNHRGERPDLVLIDDPETRGTLRSPAETQRHEDTIDADITGLAGPTRRIAILYAGTVAAAHSLAARYSDPEIKPAWAGTRRRQLEKEPDRLDLWDKYLSLRAAGPLQGDETGREAFRFYRQHRRQMDAGAVVGNPHRYDQRILPDGTPVQLSALQACYDIIADTGREHFDTEYQNIPPTAGEGETIRLTDLAVCQRTNHLDRGTTPPEADFLTAGIDVGTRALHWTVVAWKQAAATIIDYGTVAVHSPLTGRLEDPENAPAVQDAILAALLEFRDMADAGWIDSASGERRHLDLALIDVGYARASLDTPVWEFIAASPGTTYRASKGYGTGSGQTAYRHPTKRGGGRRLHNHCFATYQPTRRTWLYHLDADYWKHFVHTALAAGPGRPGSLTLFGREPAVHRQYARQITAEEWTHEFHPTRGDVWAWRPVRGRGRHNHWLDTTYAACCAAGILGLKTAGFQPAAPGPDGQPAPRQRPDADMKVRLSDLKKGKRR